MKQLPKPPAYLSDLAKTWWKKLNAEFEFGPDALLILEAAMQAFDRWVEARDIVTLEGITLEDRFGQVKQHPATLIERDARGAMLQGLKQLGLQAEAPQVGAGRPNAKVI